MKIEKLEERLAPFSLLLNIDSAAFDEGIRVLFDVDDNETSVELTHVRWDTPNGPEPISQRVVTIDGVYSNVKFQNLDVQVRATVDEELTAQVFHTLPDQLTADFVVEGDNVAGQVAAIDGAAADFFVNHEYQVYGPVEPLEPAVIEAVANDVAAVSVEEPYVPEPITFDPPTDPEHLQREPIVGFTIRRFLASTPR